VFNIKEGNESWSIPLDIYQTWETKELPEKMNECVERLKAQNPNFRHHLFDDASRREFIQYHFDSSVLSAYDKLIPGAYRADLWRYCVLYVNGGVYLDVKYSNVDDFNLIDLTDDEYFVPDLDESGGGIYNAFMICKARNPIMRRVIDGVVDNVKNEYYGESGLCPTGPILLKRCFRDDEFQKAKSNGLGVCRHNENTSVCLHGKPILTVYDDYYKIDIKKTNQRHYSELWNQRKIYNTTD
jgi:mannosyltransferase OCH1-like enzyme